MDAVCRWPALRCSGGSTSRGRPGRTCWQPISGYLRTPLPTSFDGLERLGLAERLPDPTDRRAKLVAITDAGEAGLDVANATRERLLRQIFGALSEADRATFLRLLDGLDEAARRLISTSATDVPAVSA